VETSSIRQVTLLHHAAGLLAAESFFSCRSSDFCYLFGSRDFLALDYDDVAS